MRLPGVRGSLSSVTRSTCLPPRCSWFWRETLVAKAVPRVVAPCDRRTGPRQSGGPLLDGVVWWPRQTWIGDAARRTASDRPRRRRATGRAGVRAGLAGARTPLPHLVGSSRPGKSESLLQDQRRGRRPVSRLFATRCSVSREPQGCRISSALSLPPLDMLAIDQRHVSVTLHGRSVAGCLAEWRDSCGPPAGKSLAKNSWASWHLVEVSVALLRRHRRAGGLAACRRRVVLLRRAAPARCRPPD